MPITVSATFKPLTPSSILGSAGPSFIWRDFSGAPKPGTWYVDAIANKRAGVDMNSAPEIVANFNSNRPDWYFGGDGNTPNNTYDFQGVVLHELGHGLGFVGLTSVDTSGQGTFPVQGFPASYDRFTENGAGTKLLSLADPSTALGNQLRSNNVFFDSPRVRNANGGSFAGLYAPATWQPGQQLLPPQRSDVPGRQRELPDDALPVRR